MIRYFPAPYPDELFYSIVARFVMRMGYAPSYARRILFSSDKSGPSIEFPGQLSFFESQLLWPEIYNCEKIIQDYSLFPLHSPFLSPDRQKKIMGLMYGKDSNTTYYLLGVQRNLGKPLSLKYCPMCLIEDKESFGESYWHRSHQSMHSRVCIKHNVFLEIAIEAEITRWCTTRIFPAETSIHPSSARRTGNSHKDKLLTNISEDIFWLLNQSMFSWNRIFLRNSYRYLAKEQNIIGKSGRIKSYTFLTENFIKFYTQELLELYKSELSISGENWLTALFSSKEKYTLYIRHILLIRYLGMGLSEFNQYIKNNKENWEPLSKEAASSGFNFEYIQRLWMNPNLGINQISLSVGCNTNRLIRYATRAGLPYPRPNQRGNKHFRNSSDFEATRIIKRKEWIAIRDKFPTKSMTELSPITASLVRWLSLHDNDWFVEHKPLKNILGSPRISRTERDILDQKVSEKVPQAVINIIKRPGRPVKISRTVILEQIGQFGVINFYNKLPLTKKALEENIESVEDFAFRKIVWAEEYCKNQQIRMSKSALLNLVKLYWVKNNPEIMDAFNAAYSRLEQFWNSRIHGGTHL